MGKPADTSNYIYRMGTAPNTRAAISQKNKVFSYMVGADSLQQIGVLSEFGHDESRAVDPIRGVGYGDQIAELVPGVTEPMTLTINKTLLYAVNLFQVFGYKGGVEGLVRSLKHHRWPFDVKQELVFSELVSKFDLDAAGGGKAATNQPGEGDFVADSVRALVTYYEGCWMESYSASYSADAAIVAENSSVKVTDIIDGVSTYGEFIDTGLAPVDASAGSGTSIRFAGNSNNVATPAA